MHYATVAVPTPLGVEAQCQVLDEKIVLATIFPRRRAPSTRASCATSTTRRTAFVSAYRKYKEKENFDVCIEYLASPLLDGKTLVLVDPMLATGASMELSYRALLTRAHPPSCT